MLRKEVTCKSPGRVADKTLSLLDPSPIGNFIAIATEPGPDPATGLFFCQFRQIFRVPFAKNLSAGVCGRLCFHCVTTVPWARPEYDPRLKARCNKCQASATTNSLTCSFEARRQHHPSVVSRERGGHKPKKFTEENGDSLQAVAVCGWSRGTATPLAPCRRHSASTIF